jgi:nucleoside-diphosphate-sugar epimerase
MRALITGASEFLGRNALLALPRSWDVVAIYRSDSLEFPRFVAAQRLDHVRPIACDLTDGMQVACAARESGGAFDACLYLASNTSIPDSIRCPVQDLTTNTIGLLNTLQHWTFDHLVYLSSGAVYMGLTGLVGPDSPVAPTLPYAISKLAAEHYIKAFACHLQTPTHATIVRFFGAYGPYEPARKLYTRLVRRFAFERDPRFTVLGDGENYIDAMYVDDAIRAVLAVLTAPPQRPRTIDLGLGSRETVNQVVARAARAFGLEPEIAHEGRSPEYITFAIDPQPFAALYQTTPTVSLEAGLERLAAHLQREVQNAAR